MGTSRIGRCMSVLAASLSLTFIFGLLGATSALATAPDSVTVSASAGNVAMGGSVTYTVVASNGAGNPATLSDQLNGLTGISVVSSAGSGTCSQSAGLVTCQVPVVPASTTITITGTVTAPGGTVLHNLATMYNNPGEPVVSATGTADVTVTGGTIPPGEGSGTPDLVTSIVAPSTVPSGGGLTYTLVVGNQGTGNANDITVVDTLPAGFTYAAGNAVTNATSLFSCGTSGQTVTCSGGRIDAGATATITIAGTAPSSGTFVDQAVVDPVDTTPESNYNNNTSSAKTAVAAAPAASQLGLSIAQTSPTPPDVTQGATLTYTVNMTNSGTQPITDVGLVVPTQGLDPDSLAVTAINFPPPQNQTIAKACGVAGSYIQCFMADNDATEVYINPGQTLQVVISGTVVAPPAQKVFMFAAAVGGTGSQNSNSMYATATTTTMVKPAIDLSITKASLPPTVNAAAPFMYQYVVGNSGLNTATGVVVRDPLPAGILPPKPGGYTFNITYSSPFGSGFACAINASNVLTCSGGVLPGQSTATIAVNVVAPEATGQISSVVKVDPNNTIPESDKTNNTATATTTVVPGADLVADGAPCTTSSSATPPVSIAPGPGPVCQSVNFNPVATSGTLTYTITVPNIGTQDATGLTVVDTLPAGTTFRSATGDHNFTCTASGQTVTCVGGIINGTYTAFPATDTATITVAVFAPSDPGSVTNEVRVNPDRSVPESNYANNISYLTTQVAVESGPGNGNYIDLSIPSLTSSPSSPNDASGVDAPGNPVVPNGVVQYTLTIANSGTEPAFNVEVTDTLPTGERFISATDTTSGSGGGGFKCTESSQVVDCIGGEVDAATTRTITIRAFAPATEGTYTDTAIVDPSNQIHEADEQNNTNSAQTVVSKSPGAGGTWINLGLTAKSSIPAGSQNTDTAADVVPGGEIDYTLTVTNSGQAPASGVEVVDSIPSNTTFVSAHDGSGGSGAFTCSNSGQTVDCTGGTIPAATAGSPPTPGQRTIVIAVDAPKDSTQLDVSNGNAVTRTVSVPADQASVNPTAAIPESDYTDNMDKTGSTTVQSNIDLTLKADGPSSTSQNNTGTYTLTVTNNGSARADDVAVHDPLPTGLIVENVQADPSTFGCQVHENPVNVVDCKGDLADKNSSSSQNQVTITINYFVTADDNVTFSNQACVNPDQTVVEYDYDNNCSTVVTSSGTAAPPPSPDVSIGQSDSQSPIGPGQNEVYTLSLKNKGNADTDSGAVSVSDTLPAGLTVQPATTSNGFTCTNSGQTVTCTGTLATGETATIKITATVTAAATGPIKNTATVTDSTADNPPTKGADTVTADKSATTTVNLNGTALDLVAQSMKATPDPVNQGGVLTYTSKIANTGTADSGTFTIVQNLPSPGSAYTFISGVASSGFNCTLDTSQTPNNVNCVGDLLPGAATTVTVQLEITSSATGSLTSKITANPAKSVAETDYTNNSQTAVTTVTSAHCSNPPGCVDLSQSDLTATPSPVPSGSTLTYSYAVGNAGTQTAHGVYLFVSLDNFGEGFTVNSANASNGYTCDIDTSIDDVVCYDHSSGCTFSFITFTLSCAGSDHSDLAPTAGVVVTVVGTVTAPKDSDMNADAFFHQSTTDFSPGDDAAAFNDTSVIAAGPAKRGVAAMPQHTHPAAVACTTKRIATKGHHGRSGLYQGRKRHKPKETITVCVPRGYRHTGVRHGHTGIRHRLAGKRHR